MQPFNFSDTYKKSVEAGALFHATHKTWSGKGTLQYKEYLKMLIDKYNIKTILDFGCGKGMQYSVYNLDKELGVTVVQYDPCIHGLDSWPEGNFDMVIALDCIGRVSLSDLNWLYESFSKWANHCVFIASQTGWDPKDDKTNIDDGIIQSSDLITHGFKKFKDPDFYIMNNFSFILEP
jgi:hypothetical protein